MAAGISVGIAKDNLAGKSLERCEDRISFAGGVFEDSDGMVRNDGNFIRERNVESLLKLIVSEKRAAMDVVERGRAGTMDAPRLFAHGNNASTRGVRGGEVEVGHLGEGV